MGIKHLNRFLRDNCAKSIQCIHISNLAGKKVAIDASIYMYKFAGDNSLIENMYLMLSIFRHYNIIPVFIFDGKPPAEKRELLVQRREMKLTAEKEYKQLQSSLQMNSNIDEEEKQEIIATMDLLKTKFVYIQKEQIDSVKGLIRAFGMSYYDAIGEADELCALLVIKKKVWACMSEDMDMFVYGCNRVLRYFSLLNHSVVLYHLKNILEELGINQKEFREICVLSGTDYNINNGNGSKNSSRSSTSLHSVLKLFKKFHKMRAKCVSNNDNDIINSFMPEVAKIGDLDTEKSPIRREWVNSKQSTFYEWLSESECYPCDYNTLIDIYNKFDITGSEPNLKIFEKVPIANGSIIEEDLRPILEKDGFIFPM